MEWEMPIVVEVTVTINSDGTVNAGAFGVSPEETFPFEGDYAAYDGEEWLSKHDVNEKLTELGGEIDGIYMDYFVDAWQVAADEVSKGAQALHGVRAIHARFYSDDMEDGGPSGADVCDALLELMGNIGLQV